ncbi:pyridoxal phosphate-dependent aminotransferase, partial [bacterium]|nr:pyridoxal phosphate-dependent aminotransferase [bacterium]
LNAIKGVRCPRPQGGLYVFPDFSEIEPSSQQLFKRLLAGGVAVAPGLFFGSKGEGHARIMFATSYDTISAGLDRIEAALG